MAMCFHNTSLTEIMNRNMLSTPQHYYITGQEVINWRFLAGLIIIDDGEEKNECREASALNVFTTE